MNRKYLALAASLILGTTGSAFAQTSGNEHSMHHANRTVAMCTNCPGMQGGASEAVTSESAIPESAKPADTKLQKGQPDYSRNPYRGPNKDWGYISINHP